MEEKTITIPMEEYKNLVETAANVKAFNGFVNRSNYAIDRDDCGRYLGFEVVGHEK